MRLNKDLGLTDADRVENIRRIGDVAKLMTDAGLIVLTAFISSFCSERRMVRQLFPPPALLMAANAVPRSRSVRHGVDQRTL
jgi:adenylylsulfate kinase-like enzyme